MRDRRERLREMDYTEALEKSEGGHCGVNIQAGGETGSEDYGYGVNGIHTMENVACIAATRISTYHELWRNCELRMRVAGGWRRNVVLVVFVFVRGGEIGIFADGNSAKRAGVGRNGDD